MKTSIGNSDTGIVVIMTPETSLESQALNWILHNGIKHVSYENVWEQTGGVCFYLNDLTKW